jgi:hypothetical protein
MISHSNIHEALKSTPGCLTLQELEALAENPSSSHPHLAQCPRCQSELGLLKSFESSAPLPDEGAAVAWISKRLESRLDQIKHPGSSRKARAQRRSWLFRNFGFHRTRWLVPAFGAPLVIAVVSVAVMHHSREPQLRADSSGGPVVYRSQEVQLTSPLGELPEAPKLLQWKAFPGTSQYKVSLQEVDGVTVWSAETAASSIPIPPPIRAKMLPGKPLLWRVTALDSDGRVLAASQLQRFSPQLKSSRSISGVLSH